MHFGPFNGIGFGIRAAMHFMDIIDRQQNEIQSLRSQLTNTDVPDAQLYGQQFTAEDFNGPFFNDADFFQRYRQRIV